jgi:transmembrane sensor
MEKMHKKENMVIHLEEEDKDFRAVYPRMSIPWTKSKGELWESFEKEVDHKMHQSKVRRLFFVSIAASMLLLIGLGITAMLKTTSVETLMGEHHTLSLPDGSMVTLNAESKITFKPWYWAIFREVNLDGEAYFEVKKGRKFEVKSNQGTVRVLGTSFVVYNREKAYEVTCITGKVRVNVKGEMPEILSPQQKLIARDDRVEILKDADKIKELSWLHNSFAFQAVPLYEVLREISRQYNVQIDYQGDFQKSYTGVFPKATIEEVLSIVCKPFGYQYVSVSENKFKVTQQP